MTGYQVVSWARAFHSMKSPQCPMSPSICVSTQSVALPPSLRADASHGPSIKALPITQPFSITWVDCQPVVSATGSQHCPEIMDKQAVWRMFVELNTCLLPAACPCQRAAQ